MRTIATSFFSLVCLGGVGCLTLGCATLRLSERDREELMEVPAVPVVFQAQRRGEEDSFGSALVLNERELLLTPHQVAPVGFGKVFVEGRVTHYQVVESRRGLHELSGGAKVLLEEPLRRDYRSLPMDFTTPLPEGARIFVVGYPQDRREGDLDARKQILSGRALKHDSKNPPEMREFLPVSLGRGEIQGASGSPVMWRRPFDGALVVVGIYAGVAMERKMVHLVWRPSGLANGPDRP